MIKKRQKTWITLLLVLAILSTTRLLISAYDPTFPAKLDDNGWSEQGIQEVVNANNQFALDLYSKLNEDEDGNIFYSPYSIFSSLAMTYEGAKGQTAEEMELVLHYPDKNILRPNYAALFNNINRERTKYELRSPNALWTQNDFPFNEDYIKNIENFYGGKATNVDFINEPEKSRQIINDYIEEQTKGKIKEILPPESIDSLTKLVITNPIYFKGAWVWQFDESKTSEQNFTINPGNVVQTPMMQMASASNLKYANLEDLEILELPFNGNEISMMILLPKSNLSVIEPSLTAEKLIEYKNQMSTKVYGNILLPKFEFDSKFFMKEVLSSLGMPNAFGGNANFSGISSAGNLFIKDVIHQAYIKVDERGTVAAATTTSIILMGESDSVFKADHPFIFIIQDIQTGIILFMGRVTDPSK